MTLNAIGFLALGCIILYGGLITTIAIAVKSDKKDGFIMKPIQRMKYRPMLMSGKDKVRQGKGK